MNKKCKSTKTSNIILVVLGVFLLAFIITMIIVFCVKGSTPDTLIQCVLGAGGFEAIALAGIKISKVCKGEKTNLEGEDYSGEL
jgi:hypothetical protein